MVTVFSAKTLTSVQRLRRTSAAMLIVVAVTASTIGSRAATGEPNTRSRITSVSGRPMRSACSRSAELRRFRSSSTAGWPVISQPKPAGSRTDATAARSRGVASSASLNVPASGWMSSSAVWPERPTSRASPELHTDCTAVARPGPRSAALTERAAAANRGSAVVSPSACSTAMKG